MARIRTASGGVPCTFQPREQRREDGSLHWIGSGLRAVGRRPGDPVVVAEGRMLMAGRHPQTGAALLPPGQVKDFLGLELGVQCPNSVALAALLGPPDLAAALRQRWHAAIQSTFPALEARLGPRVVIRGGEALASGFLGWTQVHPFMRYLDSGVLVMGQHTHVVVANLAAGSDGWGTLADGDAFAGQAQWFEDEVHAVLRHDLHQRYGARFARNAQGAWS